MENILDSKVPDIGVNVLKPTRYTPPPPQPKNVDKQMVLWYSWLVSHVPETIRRPVSATYKKMKDKVVFLYTKEDLTIKQVQTRRLLGNTVAHFEIRNRVNTSTTDFLENAKDLLIKF